MVAKFFLAVGHQTYITTSQEMTQGVESAYHRQLLSGSNPTESVVGSPSLRRYQGHSQKGCLFRRLQFMYPYISHFRKIFFRRSKQNGSQTGLSHILMPQLLRESTILGIIKENLTQTRQFNAENHMKRHTSLPHLLGGDAIHRCTKIPLKPVQLSELCRDRRLQW